MVPEHYIPSFLSKYDKTQQKKELKKSRKKYKEGKYHTRKKIKGYTTKKTPWINRFKKLFSIKKNTPLSLKTVSNVSKCSKKGLKEIIAKGKGAYYSSGSRPNQTADSWGKARLYSTLSGGPASRYDKHILDKYCKKNSKSLKLAKNPRKNTQRKRIKLGGARMRERILSFKKSPIKNKKYRALIQNIKTKKTRNIDFGGLGYEQYKDRTGVGLYTNVNHGNRKRMRNYFNRHSGTPNRKEAIEKERKKSDGYYNAKILSHEYLW